MTMGAKLETEDDLSFLTLDEPPATPAPAPVETPQPAADPGTAAQPDPQPDPAPAQPQQPGFVPLSAVLDEREKRQKIERDYAEAQKKWEAAQPPKQAPSVTSDPQGWQAEQEQRFAKREMDLKMELSGRFAAQHHGADKIEAAKQWGAQQNQVDPYFGQKFTAQNDPFGWLVEQHRQALTLGEIGNKTAQEWALEYAASMGYAPPAAPQQQQTVPAQAQPVVQPKPVPRSIANVAPAGTSTNEAPIMEGDLVNSLFK